MDDIKENTCIRRRVPFTKKEDKQLMKLVARFGESNWNDISKFMPNRTKRQCRERWQNSLSPKNLKKKWSNEEDNLLLQKYNIYGPHWKVIESFFYGRTSYSLRNRFNSLKKKNSEKFNYTIDEKIQTESILNELNRTNLLDDNYFDDIENQNGFDYFDIFQ